jgi:DNA-binding transcriptional LysR family regulator
MRDLEDELGSALFNRHSGGVRLTNAGRRFLPKARKVLRDVAEGYEVVDAIGRVREGSLRIGIFSSLASGFLFQLLQIYGREHDGVHVEFVEGNPADHVAAIRQLRLDVAFLTGTAGWAGCETEYLWSERVFAVLPERLPIADKEELTWHDLAGHRFIVSDAAPGQEIHDYLVQRLATLGHHPQIHIQHVSRDNLLPLVAVGRGLTVMHEAATAAHAPGIVYRPIADEILPYSAVWSPKNDNPALRRFLSLAREQAKRQDKAL